MIVGTAPGTVTTTDAELRRIAKLIRTGSTTRAIAAIEALCRRERQHHATVGRWIDRAVREDQRHARTVRKLAREARDL